jgi:hypothetical protein
MISQKDTMKKLIQLGLLAIAAAPSANAAPTNDSNTSPKARSAVHASKAKSFKTLPQKKNGSGVQVAYRLEGTPTVGKPLTITLQFDRVSDAEGGAVDFTTDSELVMNSSITKKTLTAKRSTSQQIIVTPQNEGLFYVNVFTEQAGRKSAAAIPVQVGKTVAVMKTLGKVTTDANGERIISMPAQ